MIAESPMNPTISASPPYTAIDAIVTPVRCACRR
jgi:hypothetical protein